MLPQNFDEAAQAVTTQMPGRVAQDTINRALSTASIVLIVIGVLFVVLMLVSIIAVFIFTVVRPPSPPARASSTMIMHAEKYAASLPWAVNFLSGLFRKT